MKLTVSIQNKTLVSNFDTHYIQNQDGTAYLYVYGVDPSWLVKVVFTRDDKFAIGPIGSTYDVDPDDVYCHIIEVPVDVLKVPKGFSVSAGVYEPQGTTPEETYVLYTTVSAVGWIYPSTYLIVPRDLETQQADAINLAIGNLTTLVQNNIIQLRQDSGYLQWKYTVGTTWNNLTSLLDITGPTGNKGVSIRALGLWNKDTAYYNNADYLDIVHYAGTAYYCKVTIETSNNADPLTDTTHWGVFVDQGTSFRIRGEWGSNTSYYVDEDHIDVVTFLGDTYYCKQSITTTGNSSPAIDTTHWGIYTEKGISFRMRGTWNSSATYRNDNDYIDVVQYGGKVYYCILAVEITGLDNPFIDTTHWGLFLDGNMQSILDTSSTTIALTLNNGEDKSYSQVTITSIAITIPVTVGHGFQAAVNFKSGSSPVAVTFTNNSSYSLKKIQYGLGVVNYTPTANRTVSLMLYCDGLNLYCYINEVE